jgi:hypothetical protein
MSVAAGFARTAGTLSAPSIALPRRRALLTVVPVPQSTAPRAPFAAAVVALLVSGLIGLLVLNTYLGKDAFQRHALQVEGRKLADQEQFLTREVEALRAPSALAEKAAGLGMVQAGPPAFLRLPGGEVLGAPAPAEAPVPADGEAPVPQPMAQAPAEAPAQTTEQTTDESTENG